MQSAAPRIRRRLIRVTQLLALCGFFLASQAVAQPAEAPGERPPIGSARSVVVPKAPGAPVMDGALDDAAWSAAALASDFWISLENRRPSERTEVLVMADGANLYFGFRVHDSRPDLIQALQTRRDAGLALDDRVTVELDPFRTFVADTTSKFSVSARGAQDDVIGSGRARQIAWKGDWKAAATRTDYGWSAEIAIPFAILNFDPKTDTFGANFYRYHNRTRELSQWADTTPQNRPEQIGRLSGLTLPQAGEAEPWTFLPYGFYGRNVPGSDGRIDKSRFDAGIDIRYQPRSNFTGLISLNPDLSQIEKAVTDIDFSYNEKSTKEVRPFFQEGSSYYGGNESYYFYSNRIPDFDYGARAFGRFGANQFGAFVTTSPKGRIDYFAQVDHQFDETHRMSGVVVMSDREAFENTLYALRGTGREDSGLNYSFELAATETQDALGDGTFAQGKVGWTEDYWSMSMTLDRYSRHFFPANGIVDRDLLDTHGATAAAGYYQDFAEGPLYNAQASLYWQRRYTGDGDLQKDYVGASGSLEFRREIRLTLAYDIGEYRPVGGRPGSWADRLNNDRYWTAGLDFNTRNSRLSYGVSHSDGIVAGSDYRYTSAYLKTRPTDVTYFDLSVEQLSLFGKYNQVVATGGWDITPQHNVSARVIRAYYGDSFRGAWTWRIRKFLDLFAVYEAFEGETDTTHTFSMKLVLTLR